MFRGIKGFKKELLDFADRIPRGAQAEIRRTAATWFGEVVTLTPKDTNFAASEWKTSINQRPPSGSVKHPGGGAYLPSISPTFYNLKADDTLYIYNNVEYIGALENGHSTQAPANFFKNSARRANRRLQQAFNRLS